jgi:hypothetical protein
MPKAQADEEMNYKTKQENAELVNKANKSQSYDDDNCGFDDLWHALYGRLQSR